MTRSSPKKYAVANPYSVYCPARPSRHKAAEWVRHIDFDNLKAAEDFAKERAKHGGARVAFQGVHILLYQTCPETGVVERLTIGPEAVTCGEPNATR